MCIKETDCPWYWIDRNAGSISVVNMKLIIIAACVIASAYAAPPDAEASVNQYKFENNPDGSFVYGYETSNGIQSQVSGHVEPLGKDEVALKVSGSSQFISPEGQTIQLTYVADENGYQPQGAHLPTPPPPEAIPDYILRSLEYIKAHPYVEKH